MSIVDEEGFRIIYGSFACQYKRTNEELFGYLSAIPASQFLIFHNMAQSNHHLKRLKHSTNSFGFRTPLPADETIRQSIQSFSVACNNPKTFSRPFKPAPCRARRGGARVHDRKWYSSVLLPKRAINYDLAESFMDHSTNPLSSDLYKFRFKHSAKQWPNGRFINHKEKLDKSDGNTIDITCVRTFPIVPKRKKMQQIEEKTIETTASIVVVNPIAQEQKKKLADKQTNIYANLFGCGKIPRLSAATHIKKTNSMGNSTTSSASKSPLGENKEDQQC